MAYKNAFDLVEPTSPDPVVYKIRYKDSQFDVHWQQQRLGEENYDKIKVTDSDSVLEMRKDVFTGERAEAGDELKIASIIDETMTIHSPYLIDIMPEIVGYYPCSKSSGWKVRAGHRSLTLSKPYRMLGGARPKLGQLKEKYKEDIANGICNGRDSTEDFKTESITINHIERLEHELDKVLETPVMLEKKGYLQTPPVASFDMLWLLFRPGTEVCTIINGNLVCCRVLNPFWDILQAGEVDSATRVTLELRMWFLDFNGMPK